MSRTAVKQKRGSTIGRNSEHIDEVLRHVGTKQMLFLETHMCTINRITLLPTESFSESKALALVEKYHRKRQSHCNVSLLEDRFSLQRIKQTGKIPFRPWVYYKEIQQFHISHARPEYFVLCIDSHHSLQRYYEIYKCKTGNNVRKVEEFMRRAMNDPDKILRDVTAIGQVTVDPGDETRRSVANFEMQSSRDTYVDNDNAEILSPSPEFTYESPESQLKVSIASPIQIAPVKEAIVQSVPTAGPEISFRRHNINDLQNVTYITTHPDRGAFVSEEGPIYMFLSRQENHPYADKNNEINASSWNHRASDRLYSYKDERDAFQVGY